MVRTPPASECLSVLSPEETARLQGFRQPADQWRLLIGRSILRLMLAEDHGIPAAEIALTAKGKPVLAGRHRVPLDFSITHDGPWVAVGITTRGLIGIDLSQISHFHDWDTFATDYLNPAEIRQLHDLPVPDAQLAAARLWTAKEAILKAAGYGLEVDPRGIVLELAPALIIRQLPACLPQLESFHLEEGGQLQGCRIAIARLYDGPAVPLAATIRELPTQELPCVQAAEHPVLSP